MRAKIISTATALPEHLTSLDESMEYARAWVKDQPERLGRKILRIFKYAQVDQRFSVRKPASLLDQAGFGARNDAYVEQAINLGEKALRSAIKAAGIRPEDIDYLITTSCTGIMIPSVDAYLIDRLGMRQDITRLPVTEMGCAAGTSGLIYAHDFLEAYPEKYVAVLAIEFPSCTFQSGDFSMTNVVSSAIFGDGVACTILGPTDQIKPAIVAREMYHFPDSIDMMGYDIRDSGFHMVLHPDVPTRIESHFENIIFPFLEKHQVDIEQINHLIFHPGGKKIIQMVERLLGEVGKQIDDSKAVLREYGNMSSATVLFVLDRFLKREISKGDYGLMLSFGPGFSAQRLLLQWC